MNLPINLTNEERAALRAELVVLEARIRAKILKITWTNQKLPYDRLAKGRRLKELVLLAIRFLDEGRMVDLGLCVRELPNAVIKLKN
ncbi:hypothetical protein [Algoriphagus boritolerans]|uniref:Uncharacterized protein n=1 Tax=Algoriphagus boritolerans DSM 17298 = JCM 18970 TaxID=1120964 RepID=A0A1H5ZJC6_9BACT|nr:hypothetical protein [Algoriphagus boritolerans]SEG35865.1 hypothetical protein SAMN03080598_03527 [Algoriphagus boritolerans DSM 17298 = JCM 18970]